MNMVHNYLKAAAMLQEGKDYPRAVIALYHARDMARQYRTIRGRLIATHCTIAIQALLPLAVDQRCSAYGMSDYFGALS